MRYNHWFWNSRFMDSVESLAVYINNYIWSKKYGRR